MRARPLANLVEREGEQIQASLERKATCVLEDHGFNTNRSIKHQEKVFESIKEEEVMLAREKVCQAIEELNRGQEKGKQIDISELNETGDRPECNQSEYFH